ncbi:MULTISPECIES: hypothetical protein [Pseudomonas]|jgi:hypothetical protein|uniref:Uncharacterized protein n=1 Tax=Pseudomonas straminea TaxID=47882 RepID=A0A1I1WMU8_PSEOC|nr:MULTISPECIES: hypothetical protein [Pseudomonas]MDD1509554.1 hypothetical protein [Pseudomonas sp. CNPSo 3701]OLU34904.1 hypothetical protein BVH06_04600 [Pseudomonas sp. PA27(2017)]GLX15087.1 hypothetical protein Pstr01_33260 [Pseudomonas straminea]SFD96456.1 hypothetical protein SAMN05216372_10659 [Pseudomonas straminea]
MPGIVLTVAQAAELLPLASQQLGRIQHQQDAANEKGIPENWGVDEWQEIVEALQGPIVHGVVYVA